MRGAPGVIPGPPSTINKGWTLSPHRVLGVSSIPSVHRPTPVRRPPLGDEALRIPPWGYAPSLLVGGPQGRNAARGAPVSVG